jgi:hypothetical protein
MENAFVFIFLCSLIGAAFILWLGAIVGENIKSIVRF